MMLNHDQKEYLDKKIDAGIPVELNFVDQKSAILNILRAVEVRRNGVEQHRQLYGAAIAQTTLDLTREALQHCANWIGDAFCSDWNEENDLIPSTSESEIEYGLELLQKASEYSELCDVMTMLWLDNVEVNYNRDEEIELVYTSEQIQFEAAQWLWRLENSEIPAPHLALRQFESWINSEGNWLDPFLIFSIPINILENLYDGMIEHSRGRWELPEDLDLEMFSILEFRDFTNALMTLSVVPRLVFNSTHSFNVSIPIGRKMQWIDLLSKLSNVDSTKVESIFDLLTYSVSSTRSGKNKRKAEGVSQPIFQIDSDLFAVSSMYVLISNSERNLFDLLSSKLPSLYDKKKEEKERQWANELANRFKTFGLRSMPQKKYQFENRKGDIDVFVYDEVRNVGLVIQLKWLLVDRIKSRHLKDASYCIEQCKKAIEWIQAFPDNAKQVLNLSDHEIGNSTFLPLAVMREGLLNGFVFDSQVPLLNEQIFDTYITKNRNDIEKIWKLSAERRFLPICDYHYKLEPGFIPQNPFNGIRFKRQSIKPQQPWEPWTDIIL